MQMWSFRIAANLILFNIYTQVEYVKSDIVNIRNIDII